MCRSGVGSFGAIDNLWGPPARSVAATINEGNIMRLSRVQPAIASAFVAAVLAAPASAALAPAKGFIASSLPAAATSAVVTVTDFDVTGIYSNEELGDPLNEVRSILLAPNASVIGIGWDVTLFADAPSWLSEMVVSFGATSSVYDLFLTPGVGDSFPGTASYTSGGIVDLVGLGLDFDVDADGMLRLEFFEDFNDYPLDWDRIWRSGTLSIQWSVPGGGVVPEPGSWAMLLVGFGLVGFAARRRRNLASA